MDRTLRDLLVSEAARMEAEGNAKRAHVRIGGAKEPSQVYSVRIPTGRIEELRKVAAMSSQAPSTLLRRWVLERLVVEAARLAEPSPDSLNMTTLTVNPGVSGQSLLTSVALERLKQVV